LAFGLNTSLSSWFIYTDNIRRELLWASHDDFKSFDDLELNMSYTKTGEMSVLL